MEVNKIVYCLLAFFLGGLGVHKFYIQKANIGFIYLIFCWTAIPGFIGMIEAVITLFKPSDLNGNIII